MAANAVGDPVWKAASEWVNKNKGMLVKKAKIYLTYSAYEMEDFIQQAHLAAYLAANECTRKGEQEKFEQYFWVTFKNQCQSLISSVQFEEYQDDRPETASQSDQGDPLSQLLVEESVVETEHDTACIYEALELMSANQRVVWEHILGFPCGKQTMPEIARKLLVSKQRVIEIRDEGLERVREYVTKRLKSKLTGKVNYTGARSIAA